VRVPFCRWQDAQFRKLLATFPKGTAVSVIDFAENYSFLIQNEIQSLHWYSDQVTILVHIVYSHAEQAVDGRESTEENRDIVKELHFYISDDKEHGTVFVQHCMVDVHFKQLEEQKVTIQKHVVFFDGAASQFESAHGFYFVARHCHLLTGVPMEWHFFESGHGKGEHDGMGGLVKSALQKWQLLDGEDAPKLTNAEEVVEVLKARLSSAAPSSFPSRAAQRAETARHFHLIRVEDVKDLPKLCCETVRGTRGIHHVWASRDNPKVLFHRQLSCFCVKCWAEKWDECENLRVVGSKTMVNLRPTAEVPDAEVDDPEGGPRFGGDFNELSDLVGEGDNFAIVCDDEMVDYYVLQCTKVKRVLTEV
jgi:hypothetical protein